MWGREGMVVRSGEVDVEGCARAKFRLYPNATTMQVNNFAADGQPDARTWTVVVEPLEHREDLRGEAGLNTDAIVAHPNMPRGVLFFTTNRDGWSNSFFAELQGVREQIAE